MDFLTNLLARSRGEPEVMQPRVDLMVPPTVFTPAEREAEVPAPRDKALHEAAEPLPAAKQESLKPPASLAPRAETPRIPPVPNRTQFFESVEKASPQRPEPPRRPVERVIEHFGDAPQPATLNVTHNHFPTEVRQTHSATVKSVLTQETQILPERTVETVKDSTPVSSPVRIQPETRIAPAVSVRLSEKASAQNREAVPPTIQVTIGTVEVRATPRSSSTERPSKSKPAAIDLDEYLRQRAQAGSR